jgi:glutamyl-tRNA reductase
MPILALGISHRHAPIDLLERLAFGHDDLQKAYHHLTRTESVRGAVLLSTCNRVEVYADVDAYHSGFQALKGFLADSRDVPPDDFGEPLYSHYEEQAVEHLLSVAAGLDSMVLGEPQILAQVRQAYKEAEAEAAAGPVLSQLFRRAIRAGRRARSETAIGASPAAFVQAGATLAEQHLGRLAGLSLSVVGAGKMSELAVRELLPRGVGPVRVLARVPERAARVAKPAGGEAMGLDRLPEALAESDLVVSATGSTAAVIDAPAVRRAQRERSGRPMFVLDLGVPRDVEPEAAVVPGVRLANIDNLRVVVARTDDDDEIARVQAIVREEVGRFIAWRRAVRLAPMIQGLYDRGERIRRSELDRVAARLAGLSEDQRDAVDAATMAIVAKLLHRPVVRAKDLHGHGDARAKLLAELFDLELPAE